MQEVLDQFIDDAGAVRAGIVPGSGYPLYRQAFAFRLAPVERLCCRSQSGQENKAYPVFADGIRPIVNRAFGRFKSLLNHILPFDFSPSTAQRMNGIRRMSS